MKPLRLTEIVIPAAIVMVITALIWASGSLTRDHIRHPSSLSSVPDSEQLSVGDTPRNLTIIDHPGAYGLGTPPAGSIYGLANGHLVRVSATGGQLESILWSAIGDGDR